MGGLCSKSDKWADDGGHRVLGASAQTPSTAGPTSNPIADPRKAAAEAAERRLKESQARGTNAANPKRGELAAKANKPVKLTPEPREEERIVWD